MVHEIQYAMFEINKGRFCWCIHVATEVHSEILKIIASLDSDLHESINLLIE